MDIGGGGATDVNVLFSDTGAFRNEDFVSNAGLAYFGSSPVNGSASNFTQFQCKNPSGSGVVVLLDKLVVVPYSDTVFTLRDYDTDLTSTNMDWRAVKQGEANGNAEMRYDHHTSAYGTHVLGGGAKANTGFTLEFKNPVILIEGQALLVAFGSTNVGGIVSWFGREV